MVLYFLFCVLVFKGSRKGVVGEDGLYLNKGCLDGEIGCGSCEEERKIS